MKTLEGVGAIVADPSSLFCRVLLTEFEKRGQPAVLLNRWRYWDEGVPGNPPQVTTKEFEGTLGGRAVTALSAALEFVLRASPRWMRDLEREKAEGLPPMRPLLADAVSIGLAIRRLKPKFVFGQDIFLTGPSIAASAGVPRILMPFGGDIFHYSEISTAIHRMVGVSLRRADLIVPSATSAVDRLVDEFHVPRSRVCAISWGVDTNLFRPRSGEQRRALRERYGIAHDALVVMNLRRMQPFWGSDAIEEAFVRLAHTLPRFHAIVMSGSGDPGPVHALQAQIPERGTFIVQDVPLSDYADLVAISDIGVSAMRVPDMRSWSILQAAAAGLIPILVDQPEYRAMERDGLRAIFFDHVDAGEIADAVTRCVDDEELRRKRGEQNRDFIVRRESFDTQMDELVGRVVGLAEGRSTRCAE
ncbi:MAG TPA: glycosyltransferase [Thermoanaerobaculia bacterium]